MTLGLVCNNSSQLNGPYKAFNPESNKCLDRWINIVLLASCGQTMTIVSLETSPQHQKRIHQGEADREEGLEFKLFIRSFN